MISNSIIVRPKVSWLLKGLWRYPKLLWGVCRVVGTRVGVVGLGILPKVQK